MTIRRVPADFRVIERLRPEWLSGIRANRAGAAWAIFSVSKTSLTTPEAAQRLGKAIGCPWGRIGWAGLKDKHAVTTQAMCVPAAQCKPGVERIESPGFAAELLGWSDQELAARAIERNDFEIVVRDLSRQAADLMSTRWRMLKDAEGAIWIANYFGEQRFASARHGKGFAGERLIAGDYEGAVRLMIGTPARKDSGKRHEFTRACATHWGKWQELLAVFPKCAERGAIEALAGGKGFAQAFAALPYLDQQMAVEAYQSHLWNRMLAAVMNDLAAASGQQAATAPDASGELSFCGLHGQAAMAREWMLPIPAKGVDLSLIEAAMRQPAQRAMQAEGVRMDQLAMAELRRPAFTSIDRPVAFGVRNGELSTIERDDLSPSGTRWKRTLRCGLGPGSYATVVLRALGQ